MNEKLPLLQLVAISQIYESGGKRFEALRHINLTIEEGEFVALLGPSGCGKSTLLRLITGLLRPSAGQVLYRGWPLQGINPHATIVFQSFALFPWLTVQENVEVVLQARGLPPKLQAQKAIGILDQVGLDGFENAYPRELSGGMRQKVGFARAMAVEPELLCLDEPFSALDVLSAESLRGDLLELWLSGKIPTKAILLVTHNIEEAVQLADRIIIMDTRPGRIIGDLRVHLPQPRSRKDLTFLEFVDRIYALLAGQTQPEAVELGTAPGEPGPTRPLPHVNIESLAELLEYLETKPEKQTDIFALAQELQLSSDELLTLIEAAELLGFATVAHGDITLTTLGETFAAATIVGRKEIFATRIRRLPFFRWLWSMLQAAEGMQLKYNLVLTALELEFPPEEAERQLNTAIDWGRYAEMLGFDKNRQIIFPETGPAAP